MPSSPTPPKTPRFRAQIVNFLAKPFCNCRESFKNPHLFMQNEPNSWIRTPQPPFFGSKPWLPLTQLPKNRQNLSKLVENTPKLAHFCTNRAKTANRPKSPQPLALQQLAQINAPRTPFPPQADKPNRTQPNPILTQSPNRPKMPLTPYNTTPYAPLICYPPKPGEPNPTQPNPNPIPPNPRSLPSLSLPILPPLSAASLPLLSLRALSLPVLSPVEGSDPSKGRMIEWFTCSTAQLLCSPAPAANKQRKSNFSRLILRPQSDIIMDTDSVNRVLEAGIWREGRFRDTTG